MPLSLLKYTDAGKAFCGFGIFLLVLIIAPVFAHSQTPSQVQVPIKSQAHKPKIAIIIDDIGDRQAEGLRAVNLPGPVACAFLPYTPYSKKLARRAHKMGKEVLLHLPLQAIAQNNLLGRGSIKLHDSEQVFRTTVRRDLAAIPFVSGVNNHMGSLLTRHPGAMAWLMSELERQGDLFFVDSYTTPKSVALQLADEYNLPATRRDVFLDNKPMTEAITQQFQRLIQIAKRDGHALAIGHPHPETLAVLEKELARLDDYGVVLTNVRHIIALRQRDAANDVDQQKVTNATSMQSVSPNRSTPRKSTRQ